MAEAVVAPSCPPKGVVTAVNVKTDFGAKGDGKTNDVVAIQKALDYVAPGGLVFFPPGNYVIGSPLYPHAGTQIVGVHVPRYTKDTLVSECKISIIDPKFTGSAAIIGKSPAVGIRNLALHDARQTVPRAATHGIELYDMGGESNWTLEHVNIQAFSGSGLYGRWHVATVFDVRIVGCGGWGVNAGDPGNNWNDVRFISCQFCFNAQGNVWLGGTVEKPSAAIEFIGCRSERAGVLTQFGTNSKAPGWRMTRVARINLVGCTTDGNSGNGVEIFPDSADDRSVHLVQIVGSAFGRDGAGGAEDACAGIRIVKANSIRIVGSSVNRGGPNAFDDDAPTTGLTPKYGLWCTDAQYVDVVANNIRGQGRDFLFENVTVGSKMYRSNVQDMRNRLFTIPDVPGVSELPKSDDVRPGMMVWYVPSNKPLWWSATKGWVDACGDPEFASETAEETRT